MAIKGFRRVLEVISIVFFICALVILTGNVLSRMFLGRPIAGVYELIGLAGVLFGSASIVTCAVFDGHVRVDIVTARLRGLPRVVQMVFANVMDIAYYAMMAVATWNIAMTKIVSKEVTDTLKIPTGAFRAYLAVCLAFVALVRIGQFFHMKQVGDK